MVLHSIVAWDCRIGAWARVEGIPLGVAEHGGKVVRQGVKVDAATILGREVNVGEGVVVRNCVVLPNKGINNDVSNEVPKPDCHAVPFKCSLLVFFHSGFY